MADQPPDTRDTMLDRRTYTNARLSRSKVWACPHCRLNGLVRVLPSRDALIAHLRRCHGEPELP